MKLEDALLCLVVNSGAVSSGEGAEFCRRAVAGGVDLIQWRAGDRADATDELAAIGTACREEGALLVVDGEPDAAVQAGADGVHVSGPDMPVGYARSVMGEGKLIGLSSSSADEAALALDLEPDYLLHRGGKDCAAVFGALHAGQTVLYGAGIANVDEAAALVEAGVYRLAFDWNGGSAGNVKEQMTVLSRLLGRCL